MSTAAPFVVYVVGPYRGANARIVEDNVRAAEEVAFQIAAAGAIPLCVHSQFRFFNGTLTDAFWLEATMELMRRADGVVLIPGWQQSSGSRAEKLEAERLHIPVYELIDSEPCDVRAAVEALRREFARNVIQLKSPAAPKEIA